MLFVEVLATDDGSSSSNPVSCTTPSQPTLGGSPALLAPQAPRPPHLPPTLGHSNLPVLPGASLTSIRGTLTSMSPYLAGLIGEPAPRPPLPPAPPAAAAVPSHGGAEGDSPVTADASVSTRQSHSASVDSSSGVLCSASDTPMSALGPIAAAVPRRQLDAADVGAQSPRPADTPSAAGGAGGGGPGSAPDLARISAGSLTIPHRRRQTSDIEQALGAQGMASLRVIGQSVVSSAPQVPIGNGITCAADVAASENSITEPGSATSLLPAVPATRESSRSSLTLAFGGSKPPTPPTPPTRAAAPAAETSPPQEQSAWASALSTISRVLLPSSSFTTSSTAPPSPPQPAAQSQPQPASSAGQVPLPAMSPDAMSSSQTHSQLRPFLGSRSPSPLSAQDLAELVQSGCLPAPASGQGPGRPGAVSIGSKIAGAMASLRGEAPLVRLQIRVLPAAHTAEASAAEASARSSANRSSAATAAGGGAYAPRATGSAGGSSNGDIPDTTGTSPTSLLTSGSAKALSLLSKIGLCTRPTSGDDEDDADLDTSIPRRHSPGLFGASANNSVSEPRADVPAAPPPRFVAVSLEVAHGVNLAITSPYRKSRRTPSHEAISMVATQLKIFEMPPPLELGPPLSVPGAADAAAGTATPASGAGDAWTEDANGSLSVPLLSRRSTPLAGEDYEQQVTTSMASFSSLALAAGASQPPAPQSPQGALTAFGSAQYSVGQASYTGSPIASAGSVGLSFPQTAAQLSDLGSPRLITPHPQQHTPQPPQQSQQQPATPTTSQPPPVTPPQALKVGGLPMVGSVVSAAAAAQPGMLSPGPSGTLSDSALGAAAHSITHAVSPANDKHDSPTTSTAVAPGAAAKPYPPTLASSTSRNASDASTMIVYEESSSGVSRSATPSQQQQQQGDTSSDDTVPVGMVGGSGLGAPSRAASAVTAAASQTSQASDRSTLSRSRTHGASLPRLLVPNSATADLGIPPIPPPLLSTKLDAATEKLRRDAWGVYGERWAAKVRRIQRESPHGMRKGWALRCVIVKSGDDCRQVRHGPCLSDAMHCCVCARECLSARQQDVR